MQVFTSIRVLGDQGGRFAEDNPAKARGIDAELQGHLGELHPSPEP